MKAARRGRRKGARRWRARQRRVAGHAQALVTSHAEGLPAMARRAVRLIAPRIESVATYVVPAVNVERLDHSVVTALTVRLRVAALAVVLFVARRHPVIATKAHAMIVAAQLARRHQQSRSEAHLERAVALLNVAGRAARRGDRPL